MTLSKNIKDTLFFVFLLFISGSILLYFGYYNELCEGGPDNYWHYYFSKYAFQFPDFFLHHWGKPLFILLSTGFAQFGFYGIIVFNVICGLLSTIVCYKILQHLNVNYKWLIVPLLLFSPLYFIVLQSSLTEPLFSLILITGSYLYFKNKFVLASLLISFLLFSRSEGLFIIVCYAFFLIVIKQWKLLPLLGFGFMVYAIIGKLMGHDFLWYFTENPYALKSPYGHGHFMDMLHQYKDIWGRSFSLILCFSTIVLFYHFFKQKQYLFWKPISETSYVFYLIFLPAFVFLLFHLTVWHFGMCGSAGLIRVLACVLPCFAVLSMWGIHKLIFSKWLGIMSSALVILFLFFHLQSPFSTFSFPLKSFGHEREVQNAARYAKSIMPKNCKVYYDEPGIIFNLDRNPFDKVHNAELFGFKDICNAKNELPCYLFWDSQFSEFSCGVSIKDIENCGYTFLKEFFDGKEYRLRVYKKDRTQ